MPSSNLLVLLFIVVVLECWLQAWLGRVLGIGRDFFAVVLFLLLHFFVVSDVTWSVIEIP
jgi:cell shape-determining protein MreD